jgi:phosphate starvation-inducible PhoH-like protein
MNLSNSSVQVLVCDFKNASNAELAHLCGPIDANIRAIETALDVSVSRRTHSFTLKGLATNVGYAQAVLRQLMHRAAEPIAAETVALELTEYRNALAQAQAGSLPVMPQLSEVLAKSNSPNNNAGSKKTKPSHPSGRELERGGELSTTVVEAPTDTPNPELKTRKAGLVGRTTTQRSYISNILAHDLTFGVGPAGTGKTYLAVACAVDALERDLVKRTPRFFARRFVAKN